MAQFSLFFSDNQEVEQCSPPQNRQSKRALPKAKDPSQANCKIEHTLPPVRSSSCVSQGDPAYDITKETLHRVFFEMCEETDSLMYSARQSEPAIYFWIFAEIIEDLKYRQLNPPSPSKVRSALVKRIADDFVRETQCPFVRKDPQRVTAVDRKYYERAIIEPPPPNSVNSEYIAKLFENRNFKNYFQNYLQNDRVSEYYLSKCYEQVSELTKFVQNCNGCEERAKSEFSKLRKPMTLSEVRNYELEAHRILESYCK